MIILVGFCAEQNFRQIEGKHKIYTWKDRKILKTDVIFYLFIFFGCKDVIINKEGSWMIRDRED